MDIEVSLKELTEDLESREAVIEQLKNTCIDLKSKIQTLKAAQVVIESRERSKKYKGMGFKDIIMSEVEKWGTTVEEFVDIYDKNSKALEAVATCMISGEPPKNEDLFFEIAKRASDHFEIDFMVLYESLKVQPVKEEVVNSEEQYIIPKDFGGLLKFYLAKYHMSQRELSEHLGVNAVNISTWATNKCLPSDKNMPYRLSVLFKTSEKEIKEAMENTSKLKSKNKGAGN